MQRPSTKWITTLALIVLTTVPALAERGNDAKRASKNGRVSGEVGGVAVTVEYGRPQVKGRTIWGGLVPYGKVWRTGADEATTLHLAADALVEDQAIAAGTYALFTIPGPEAWTVILNEVPEQWGAFSHDPGRDALRVEVRPEAGEHVEELSFVLAKDTVILRWERLEVPIRIRAAP